MIHNVPEFSVSDLSRAVKQTVEESFSRVRVRGELSRVTLAKSGHLYSDLKDEGANLNIVCWKGSVQKLNLRPEEGMEVICTGRMTTFPGSSRYQLVVETMELAGEGALLKLLEDRRKRLQEEGLFDAIHKKPLPFLPRIIGVVTSPTGAVIRDIIHRIRDRFPCRILVWPTQVQGVGAHDEITRGIEGLNRAKPSNRPDLIIVARGGGSLEDLMAFNEENVVRAVYASTIPVISAVGHETDTTLIDYVSDMRAPTPTGAAEMAVPVLDQLYAQIMDDGVRLNQSLKNMIDNHMQTLVQTTRILDMPHRMVEPLEQKFDMIADRLSINFDRYLERKDHQLNKIAGQLQTPKSLLDRAVMTLNNNSDRLRVMRDRLIPPHDDRLQSNSRMLETLSYKSTLNRGFAVIQNKDGEVLDNVDSLTTAKSLKITVKDGAVER